MSEEISSYRCLKAVVMKALEVRIAGYRMANWKTSLGGYAREIKLLHCGGTTSFVLPLNQL